MSFSAGGQNTLRLRAGTDSALCPKALGCFTERAEQHAGWLVLWGCCCCQAALPTLPRAEPPRLPATAGAAAGCKELSREHGGLCGVALATWKGLVSESFCPLFC